MKMIQDFRYGNGKLQNKIKRNFKEIRAIYVALGIIRASIRPVRSYSVV